jgi:flagellum-specific ATP synthase
MESSESGDTTGIIISMILDLSKYHTVIENSHLTSDTGRVSEVVGLLIKGYLPGACLGSLVEIKSRTQNQKFFAEVVGFRDQEVLMMSLEPHQGIGHGSEIILKESDVQVRVSEKMLGRVLNPLGFPIDSGGAIKTQQEWPLYAEIKNPLNREPIRQPMDLGIKAINGLLSMGLGQRVGIMAGSGVGKSMLLGQMTKSSQADVNVIALIGERGREVREFIENDLGPEGLSKTVLVVATSDQSPLLRIRGAFLATAIAEYFSSLGKNVLLLMDSVTRFAMAQREIGLSVGEPPATKGYTPSVFSMLPRLLERAGNFVGEGSITGLYTVLVEGDDMNDPLGDTVRSIVDGHLVLTRKLANQGHFPAIDVLQSSSRVMKNVVDSKHFAMASFLKESIALYREFEDLIQIGAYKEGQNPQLDSVVRHWSYIQSFLRQDFNTAVNFEETSGLLNELVSSIGFMDHS